MKSTNTPKWYIGPKDLLHGFLVAAFAAVLPMLGPILETGTLPTVPQLQTIGGFALSAGIAYIIKNFLSSSDGRFMGKEANASFADVAAYRTKLAEPGKFIIPSVFTAVDQQLAQQSTPITPLPDLMAPQTTGQAGTVTTILLACMVLFASCSLPKGFSNTPTGSNCVKITVSDNNNSKAFYYCDDSTINKLDIVIKKLHLQ